MIPAIRRLSVIAATLALAPLARAADAPTSITPAQESAFLKPYITQDTMMVAHVDVGLVDTAALEKYIVDTLATIAADDPNLPQQVGQSRMIADAFLARFKQTGGRQVYILISQIGNRPPTPPIVLFPLEAGGTPKALTALLSTIPKMQPAQISDTLVVLGAPHPEDAEVPQGERKPSDLPEKIKALVPANRPEFDKALAAGSGVLQIALTMPQSSRDAMAADAPTFPPSFGGGSTDIVTKHFQYVLVTLAPPPNPELDITFQSDSPENAAASLAVINTYFKFIKGLGNSPDLGPVMAPQVNGDAVEVKLDSKKIQTAAATILPSMFTARNRAQSVASAANMRQDLLGCMMYANDNNDSWPADLQSLIGKGYIANDKALLNPTDPKHRPYEYHPFTKDEVKKLDASFTPVIWEVTDSDTAPLNVGYLDGHVEKLPNKAELTKQLDAAKEKLKTP